MRPERVDDRSLELHQDLAPGVGDLHENGASIRRICGASHQPVLLEGIYLLHGSRNARLIVAFVQGLGIAAVLFEMVLHHSSGFIAQGVVQIAIHSFILWSLYGNDKADAFFEAVETA